jgi:hypothetical protein
MDKTFATFRSASFDAEEFADYPAGPPDSDPEATLVSFEALDLVCHECPDSRAEQGIQALGATELAQDLAAVNERIEKLVPSLRGARRLGVEKLNGASQLSINP